MINQIVDEIAERLVGAHPAVVPEVIAVIVREQHARFDGRPVRDFIPLFVERHAKTELARLVSAGV